MSRVLPRTGAALAASALAVGMAVALPATAAAADDPGDTQVQILGINDFHGRIAADFDNDIAGAAVVAGAVDQLRSKNPNTIFAGAGDFIGASTFASFVAHDKPTIDALNDANLDVSSVGNHEFDQGYDDLTNRVMAAYDADSNPYGGADWPYLGANVKFKNGDDALAPTWTKEVGGVTVGFVGAVTEHLHELVSPAGIKDLKITDIAKATNAGADALKADGADVVFMVVHEGYSTTDCRELVDPASDFGKVVAKLDGNVDAVISGHTHLAYNCEVPVDQRSQAGDPTLPLPVMQSGKYGANLDQFIVTVDASGAITKPIEHTLLPLVEEGSDGEMTGAYPADPDVAAVVKAAEDQAEVLGDKSIGEISGAYYRASAADGVTENRGGESNLGNLVAESHRWATADKAFGGAQIGFMNPGGLRSDMVGSNSDGYPAKLTYKQANDVQPFGNTLWTMTLTGEQIKTVLEEQWQPDGASRPYLQLGLSKGFTYLFDPGAERGHHIVAMYLDGTPIDPKADYQVAANAFLAAGGDNFTEFANGRNARDTAQIDFDAFVSFMQANAADTALPMDNSQHSIGISFPADAPSKYEPGDTVTFTLSSLTFPAPKGADRPHSKQVTVKIGDTVLGTFDVTDLSSDELFDNTGVAHVSFTLPNDIKAGQATLSISGVGGDIDLNASPITIEVAAKQLSKTGVDVATPAALGVLLLVLGGGLLVAERRRRGVGLVQR